MATHTEREAHEVETLIFPTAAEAAQWREQFGEQLGRQEGRSVRRRRELLAEELKRQFEQQGEAVGVITHPWEHTPAEHTEVQHLVDVAFARDLPAALRAARGSDHYPRNIDLFHDVLTTEMYDLLQEHKLNRQPISISLVITVGVIVVVGLVIFWSLVIGHWGF